MPKISLKILLRKIRKLPKKRFLFIHLIDMKDFKEFFMKNLLIILALALTTSVAFAADRDKARNTSVQLDTYVTPSESTDPDAAFAYRSNRDNVDDHEIFETGLDTSQFNTNQIVRISRDAKDSVLGANPLCSADFGTVTVDQTHVIVSTAVLPIRIRCTSDNGQHRVFWTTFKQ